MVYQLGGAGAGIAPGGPSLSFEQQLDAFMAAISGTESGGDYNARNDRTGAYGRWQIMPSNWPNWSRSVFGEVREQTPENQYKVAREIMAGYYRQFGSWDLVAVSWFAGPDDAQAIQQGGPAAAKSWAKDDGNITVREYVDRMREGMSQISGDPDFAAGDVQAAGHTGGSGGAAVRAASMSTGGASVEGIGSVPAVPDNIANLSDDQLVSYLNQNYGYLAWALSNAEVRPILLDIARGDITDPDRIFGQLQATEWFQTTQASARQWEALVGQDPAEANRRIDLAQDNIIRTARSFGIRIPRDRARNMAEDSLRFGWNEVEIRSALFAEADRYDPGTITATADALGQMASQYLVPVSQRFAEEYAEKIALGEASTDGWESYLRDQAASEFSGNASILRALDQGLTVRQWADPYVQKAARILEVNPADFDLTDDRWLKGIHTVDRESGETGPMSLGDWGEYLRKQPEWEYTDNARQQGAQWTQFIAERMGAG